MSDDSSDCSDMNFKPTGSRGRQKIRTEHKRKRRIVMRIEFDDSEESTSASDHTSDDEDDVKNINDDNDVGGNDPDDGGPSCSMKLRNRRKKKYVTNDDDSSFNDSNDFQRNAAMRRGGRRINVLDVGCSDGSSSGSEITRQKNIRGKKYIFSEDERESKSPLKNVKTIDSSEQKNMDEQGFTSDSSSNDLLEKCPICLLTFRQQEIGSPSTCKHIFCANCIEAWSKNVQTCPIDRIEFQSIIVRDSYENRNIVREIIVDPNAKKELVLEDEIIGEEDVTNCEICNRADREDVMLLCDDCNQGYHMDCLSPPLSEVPEGSWYCDNCVDSQDEGEDEDLHMLYEDIRDMGIPETRLRVREVHQPRILRTRQNERIRAAIIRRTRSVIARTETATSTHTTSTFQRGRTTTATTSRRPAASAKRSASGKAKRKTHKPKNRRTRQRTYVVEYDLNNFDEKFAIKTTKKIIKRRKCGRKTKTSSKRGKKVGADGLRLTASKRLAEQMGVKSDPKYTSHISGSAGGLSLFGSVNDLEYFSDSDNDGNIESEIHIETGQGTAVQTSVRISNYGSQRSRKALLLGRQPNHGIQEPTIEQNNSNSDILSSILNMQDRWHSASRNLESVHINSDGSLNLSNVNATTPSGNTSSTQITPAKDNKTDQKPVTNGPSSSDINQAPMYSRGGGNTNFNSRGGGGGYNNRSNNSQNSYRGASGGGGNQYRHSTGGTGSSSGFSGGTANSSGGINFNMIGRGNFNFSNNPNYNAPPNQQTNASPFQQRNFNQRNQQNQNNQRNNNNQQRHSLPFSINRNDNPQPQQQLPPPQNQINPFSGGMPQTRLPPPPHLLLNPQPHINLQPSLGENSLFAGLPPPMSIPPPNMNLAPPIRMSIPPPPAPPPVVIPPPLNNSLFQLNSDYGNNDDDSNCPNFSIYSHESQQVAKSSETYPANTSEIVSNVTSVSKEDDGNEDLVQLDDDDDEIPMPPEPKPTENVGYSELYEPENPTEENEGENENEETNDENQTNENVVKTATKDDGDDYDDNDSSSDEDDDMKNKDKEQETQLNSEKYDPEKDTMSECSNIVESEDLIENDLTEKNPQNEVDKQAETVRSPSPAISDIRLPEIETVSSNRKGVLELYDDSDWEELDIDRPKEFQNKSLDKSNEKESIAEKDNEDNDNLTEQDRSYTPCLDENIDPEEHGIEGGSTTPLIANNSTGIRNSKDIEESNIENMGTELISEEEEDVDRANKGKKNPKNSDKRGDRRENEKIETFKKIGGKQKGRNYRSDKQPLLNNRRGGKKGRSRSYSRSRSVDSFRSRYGKSRSRSLRLRGRSDRSRSRSRSNNKENQGRWGGNFRDGGRLNRNNSIDQINRLKRRELPRYNVRNVVGHQSPPKNVVKDRYGRDTSRNRRSSRSLSRGRRGPPPRSPFSRSRSRNRRLTISLSPSPSFNRRRSLTPRPIRHFTPARRRSTSGGRRTPPFRRRSRSPLRVMRSRSLSRGSEYRINGRKPTRQLRGVSPIRNLSRSRIRSRSVSMSPRYTPRLSRSRSKTPRPKGRKKKAKESRKKKSKRRIASMSPSPNRRISRQPDPFEIEKPKKKKRRISRAKSPIPDDHGWSPSPSPPPQPIANNYEYQLEKNVSWTPPMQSPLLGVFRANDARSVSRASRKEKIKRNKKKKKGEKRRDLRKEKKRKRRTETPEPAPSKEVFASGNNILVSVSFNKEATSSQHNQQTIVTLPPNREDLLSTRRASVDRVISTTAPIKKRKEKRKKIDTKPIAIIDLERSPFQVEQEPTDVIVLTDSEETLEREQREHSRDHSHDHRRSESCPRDVDTESHRNQRLVASGGQRGENSPERLDTILEESYDLPQSSGPKTPPEPPVVKFNLLAKKQNKVRNPLHDEDDHLPSDAELNERQQQQQQENHRSELDAMHVQSNQKIGPNTPPESGPCSPDAYDPFEPTKSPSISPRSPTPPPSQHDVPQNAICSENSGEVRSNQKHTTGVDIEQRREQIPGLGGNVAQSASLNPVDLVMALINSKSVTNSLQDLANKSNESQHNNIGGINSHEDSFREKVDENKAITVLSNLLITSSNMQHIPSISSPTPPTKKSLPGLPKIGGSVGGSSSSGVNIRNGGGTSNNADDSFNMNDIESPYSPGSADYEDLFEPPPDAVGNKRRSKRGKPEVFDNLFGSSSPITLRFPSYTPSRKHKNIAAIGQTRKTRIKVGKSNEDINKVYDDVPNSAVELHVKDKFLRKLNRQERVVEEVKLVLKPRFNRKQITKEDYKEIMRRAVPKICHSRSGEIDPFKIKKLIEAYVKKFRAKHKKLNIVNTGQVSSAVKCAAYLKKF